MSLKYSNLNMKTTIDLCLKQYEQNIYLLKIKYYHKFIISSNVIGMDLNN